MLNNINIQGRITKDIEIKTTQGGKKVASFCIACGQKIGKEERTSFIDCVAWEARAEFIAKYFQKGAMILLSGRLESRSWDDQNGNKRKAVEVIVNEVNFCGDKKQESESNFQPVPIPQNSATAQAIAAEDEAALPFDIGY